MGSSISNQEIDPSGRALERSEDANRASGREHSRATLIQNIRGRFESVGERQEQLKQSRERLVVERVNLKKSREEVRHRRVQTGDAEALFMDGARRFCTTNNIPLPSVLDASYRAVQNHRDTLGKIEDDLLQAEKSFAASEWTFIEQEDDFYQFDLIDLVDEALASVSSPVRAEAPSQKPSIPELRLSAPSPPSNISSELHSAVVESAGTRRQLNILRGERAKGFRDMSLPVWSTQQDLAFVTSYDAVLDRMMAAEVKIQQLRSEAIQNSIEIPFRRFSDPEKFPVVDARGSFETIKRARTDGPSPTFLENFSNTRKRIQEWLTDCLNYTPLARVHQKAALAELGVKEFDEQAWQEVLTNDLKDDVGEAPIDEKNYDPSLYSTMHTSDDEARLRDHMDSDTASNGIPDGAPCPPISFLFREINHDLFQPSEVGAHREAVSGGYSTRRISYVDPKAVGGLGNESVAHAPTIPLNNPVPRGGGASHAYSNLERAFCLESNSRPSMAGRTLAIPTPCRVDSARGSEATSQGSHTQEGASLPSIFITDDHDVVRRDSSGTPEVYGPVMHEGGSFHEDPKAPQGIVLASEASRRPASLSQPTRGNTWSGRDSNIIAPPPSAAFEPCGIPTHDVRFELMTANLRPNPIIPPTTSSYPARRHSASPALLQQAASTLLNWTTDRMQVRSCRAHSTGCQTPGARRHVCKKWENESFA